MIRVDSCVLVITNDPIGSGSHRHGKRTLLIGDKQGKLKSKDRVIVVHYRALWLRRFALNPHLYPSTSALFTERRICASYDRVDVY